MRNFPRLLNLLAVAGALTLSSSVAFLASTPAHAAVGDPLIVLSPVNGETTASRVVEFTGTGSDGDQIAILEQGSGDQLGRAIVGADGSWGATVTFTNRDATEQQVTVIQSNVFGLVDLTFSLPAVPPSTPLEIASPTDGAVIDSRFVTFTGTVEPGSEVRVTNGSEATYGGGRADASGAFSVVVYFRFQEGTDVTVVVRAIDPDGVELDPVTLELSLRPPLPPPVIVSPVSGSSVVGQTVTFTGTGSSGFTARVSIVATDEATLAKFDGPEDPALTPSTIVAQDGSFRVSTTLPPGNYYALVLLFDTPIDAPGSDLRALESNTVNFSVLAATPTSPPRVSEVTPSRAVLAATGPTSTGFAAPAAAALLLTGLLTVAASRRRRGQLV